MGKPFKILVVDDEPFLLFVTVKTLHAAGYLVREAATGKQALEMVESLHPDLVLLDVVLPDIDGLEVCKRIKADPRFRDIFVVLYSSLRQTPDDQADGLETGADDYVCRSLNRREFLARVRALERLKRTESELRGQKELLQLIIDSVPHLIFQKDLENRYVFCNRHFARVTGLDTPEQALGKTDADLPWHGGQADKCQAQDRRVMDHDEPVYHSIEFLDTADGQRAWFDICKIPLHDARGRVIGVLGTGEDLSERRQCEIELQRAKDAAEAANRAKSTFLANMSHELRTPLNAVLGYAQLLQRDPQISMSQREGLGIIQRSGEYLLTLINDVLDLAKIEAGKFEFQPVDFDLPGFLSDICEFFRLRAGQKGIVFRHEVAPGLPGYVHADEKRLRQILMNLLSNAVKFTEHGAVCLTVEHASLADPRHCHLSLRVEDSGIGIPEAELEHIFQPFQQASNRRTQEAGTGLGLSIVKHLLEKLGGSLQVSSTLGTPERPGGSVFQVELDLPLASRALDAARAAGPPDILGYHGVRRRILVIDDDPKTRAILGRFLGSLDFQMAAAETGAAGIDLALAWQPDLVLLDLLMPDLDGYAVARRLRELAQSRPRLQNLKLLAVSAGAFEHNRLESLAAGCDGFIAKPVSFPVLLEHLQKYLDLTWKYARAPEPDVAEAGPLEDLELPAGLSAGQHRCLLELSLDGDIDGLLECARQLAAAQPELAGFSRKLCRLAQDMRIRQVRAWLEAHPVA